MRRILATTMMMLMMTAALAGCAGDDVSYTQAEMDAATAEAESAGYDSGLAKGINDGVATQLASTGSASSTLDAIIAAGDMKCGVKESQYGMGYLDSATGVRSGLDIEYCRAVAAAIGLDPDTQITYVPASSQDRFTKLATGEIDVLIRTTTWTTSRDAGLNADFAGMNFYDGQGVLISEHSFPAADAGNSVSGLNGALICVGTGTTTEGNLEDYFAANSIDFTAVPVNDAAEATQKFKDGECDAFTGDMSAMVSKKWQLDGEDTSEGDALNSGTWIAQELLSKEPLGAATRDYDTEWNDVVEWVWFGMITAEEFGVDSTNYAAMAISSCDDTADTYDPGVCRLLTSDLGLGTVENPLAGTWMQAVLETSGNYGEAYAASFCSYDDTGDCLISRAGTANALVSEGGLQFAPPMR